MIHKTKISKYNNLDDLAEEIGDLRYDALANFIGLLADKIERDGDKDQSRNRVKLAGNLHDCANQLKKAKSSIDRAWKICEPYMK